MFAPLFVVGLFCSGCFSCCGHRGIGRESDPLDSGYKTLLHLGVFSRHGPGGVVSRQKQIVSSLLHFAMLQLVHDARYQVPSFRPKEEYQLATPE